MANIQIPILLGEVVNIVAAYTRDAANQSARTFKDEIWEPSMKLVKIYLVQVCFIFHLFNN